MKIKDLAKPALILCAFSLVSCNGSAISNALAPSADDPTDDSDMIYSWDVTQSPLVLSWQIPDTLQADYEVDVCDPSLNCSAFVIIECEGMLTCEVLDGPTGQPRNPSSYSLTEVAQEDSELTTMVYSDYQYDVVDPAQGSGTPVTETPGAQLSIKVLRYLVDSD